MKSRPTIHENLPHCLFTSLNGLLELELELTSFSKDSNAGLTGLVFSHICVLFLAQVN